jgi:sulfate permease, SulP family
MIKEIYWFKKLKGILFGGILPFEKFQIPSEVIAGIVLASIAIPEVMGYAKISGMPVITGIYTLLFPLAIFAIFCSSRHLIVGADSATAAILFSIMVSLAAPGSPKYIALVTSVAMLCAIFLIAARVLKLGFIADFLSHTVLVGFLTGVGIQISISQLSGMFGISSEGTNTIPQLINFLAHLPETNIQTLLISITVLAVILGSSRLSKTFPGALIAVIGTIIASMIFNFTNKGIESVGYVTSGLPSFNIPVFYVSDIYTMIIAAGACFIVIIAQSAATSRIYALKRSEKLDENRDILGLAFANGAAALTGTFVVNGSPTKTQMAIDSGAQSQIASLITAGVVLVVLIFLTNPISFLPNATLSAIVFLIGIKMLDFKGLKDIRQKVPSEYILALITAATVIFISVIWGIILAIIISMLWHLSHSYRPNNSFLTHDKDGKWIFAPVNPGEYTEEGLIVYRFNRDLFYANSDKLLEQALEIIDKTEPPLKWFVLDTAGFSAIDYTSLQMLIHLHEVLASKDIKMVITIPIFNLREQFKKLGLTEVVGSENIYENFREAVEAYRNSQKKINKY